MSHYFHGFVSFYVFFVVNGNVSRIKKEIVWKSEKPYFSTSYNFYDFILLEFQLVKSLCCWSGIYEIKWNVFKRNLCSSKNIYFIEFYAKNEHAPRNVVYSRVFSNFLLIFTNECYMEFSRDFLRERYSNISKYYTIYSNLICKMCESKWHSKFH